MLGYGKADQVSAGLHTRLRTRAFVVIAAETDQRVLISVSDLPLMFDSVRHEVLRRLAATYGDLYRDDNTMLTVTHTHCGPGGYSHHKLYNGTTQGFRPKTFEAIVAGIVAAVGRAHDDVAPASLVLSSGELHGASVNRSPQSFARNPRADREFFPAEIDPQTTLLRIERGGELVGAINWFATHGTSMTNRNRLVSSDNKGYAGYFWERVSHGVDYLAAEAPGFIGAFAQTNSGDMSPNLNRAPGSGPTKDEFDNTRVVGRRQADAAIALADKPGHVLSGGVDSRLTYVDVADITVRPEFTGDGQSHRTSGPSAGAAAIAGTDEGKGFAGFRQGRNPLFDLFSRAVVYRLSARLRDAQAPKGIVLPGATLNRLAPVVQHVAPVQLLRIGALYLIGIPAEVTITAGLRMRRAVAAVVGAELHDVLVAGYSNGYLHYVTTPEEYDAQRYEGGSTLFGRWEAPALTQVAVELATAMRDGRAVDRGTPPPDLAADQRDGRADRADEAADRRGFGAVTRAPLSAYRAGEQVRAEFVGAHPANNLRRGDTYLVVERESSGGWIRVADDGDWATKLHWVRSGKAASRVTVSWDIPPDVEPGCYRLRYFGDAVDEHSGQAPFVGETAGFEVRAC
jgi:neutral ceramidase